MITHNDRARETKIERAKYFYDRYHRGETYQEIADDHGITRQRVWQLVRDYRKHLEREACRLDSESLDKI